MKMPFVPGKRLWAPIAALTLALAWTAPSAQASATQSTIFDPPGAALLSKTTAQREAQLDQLSSLGADSVRLLVQWRDFAPAPEDLVKPAGFVASDPTDYPSGTFNVLDATIKEIKARGMDVLLTPDGPVPNWASAGGTKGLNRPSPSEFRQFVAALGKRYGGTCYCGTPTVLPRVDMWSVWNEPNLFLFLHPQFAHGHSVSGSIYRRLFLAAQRALTDTGHGSDPLLIGETAPSQGTVSTPPISFLRNLFCLNRHFRAVRHCAPIHAAGWAQHPYLSGYSPWAVPRQKTWISIGSLDRLTNALRRAYYQGATSSLLPVWITEFGVESYPEPATRFGVTPLRQAEYIGICEYLTWLNPQVAAYGQYLLDDDPGEEYLSFQTGLRYADGDPKPAYSSFPITLVARRIGDGNVVLWGHVRPGAGPRQVVLSYRDPEDLIPGSFATVMTNQDGYFTLTASDLDGREFRATATLPGGRVLQGPFIHSYSFPIG